MSRHHEAGARGKRAAVAALLFLLTATAWAEIAPAPDLLPSALDRCFADPRVQKLEAQDEPDSPWAPIGIIADTPDSEPETAGDERAGGLAELCPELHAGIASSDLAPFLPRDWAETVTLAKLQRFRSLLDRDEEPAARRPDTAAVAAIVAQIREAEVVKRKTLWQRFREWIRGLLLRRAGEADSNWLADWLREHSPSERAVQWTFNGLLVLLFGMVAWIVYAELRAAGLLDRASAKRREGRMAPAPGRAPGTGIALEDASETELPSVLISKLLDELRRLGRAQDRQSMTRRELERAVRFERADESDTFRELLGLAERLRYDEAAPAIASLRRIVDESRRLLESLVRTIRAAA